MPSLRQNDNVVIRRLGWVSIRGPARLFDSQISFPGLRNMGFSMLTRFFSALLSVIAFSLILQSANALEDPSTRRARMQREAQVLPSQALEALSKGDADRAIELYTKAIDSGAFNSQPDSIGNLYFQRGQAYRMKNDCNSAILDFDRAAGLIQKGDVYFLRAACYLDLKQEDKARADLDRAVQIDPQATMYREHRCIFLFNKLDFASALPDCEMALSKKPQDKQLLTAASQAAERTGNRARAAELYRMLIAVDPGNPVATEGLKRVAG